MQKIKSLQNIDYVGADPFIHNYRDKKSPVERIEAWAFALPFPREAFDFATFISVFEHVAPDERQTTVSGIAELLRPNGLLIAQIPNMYFPIEIHSGLPIQSYLPENIGKAYVSLSIIRTKKQREIVTWHRVGPKQLVSCCKNSGLQLVALETYHSPEASKIARMILPLSKVIPVDYLMTFKKV